LNIARGALVQQYPEEILCSDKLQQPEWNHKTTIKQL